MEPYCRRGPGEPEVFTSDHVPFWHHERSAVSVRRVRATRIAEPVECSRGRMASLPHVGMAVLFREGGPEVPPGRDGTPWPAPSEVTLGLIKSRACRLPKVPTLPG